uniref:Selenoprotein F n=1 Tax=Brassica oleracea var. oleracea TaxID=109376 RepID=A0A0D2ZWY5_BRAOL
MRKLVFYPEIVGFIEEEKEKFPSVNVQYIFNSPPKLIMLDEDGEHKETIRYDCIVPLCPGTVKIDNWKREHLLQYMREKVKATSASL